LLVVVGLLLLWLASWPFGPGNRELIPLPREPSFTISHLAILLSAILMVLGSTLLFREVWKGRPIPAADRRYQFQHPLAGLIECWAGLCLFLYLMLALNGTVKAPGWLMGDRTGRAAYLVPALLFRGAGMTLAPGLPRTQARVLLDLGLLVIVLSMVSLVRYPYDLIDGEFFGPAPAFEALGLGLLFAAGAATGYWYGLRRPTLELEASELETLEPEDTPREQRMSE